MVKIIKYNLVTLIHHVRGQKVILDNDIARLYEVEVKNLNIAVKRNLNRFPKDFMFQLTNQEAKILRCQIGTSKRGGRRYNPYAFTEQGVAMLSGVLTSPKAVRVNIEIMRAFVELRRMIDSNKELLTRIEKLEEKYDAKFQIVFEAIKELMKEDEKPRSKIGF